jgi:DNA-binding MarR family transcriptional regulator
MRREKLNVVSTPADAVPGHYVLDEQIGFQMRVAMQRITSIFTARMREQLTPAQFCALAKLHEVGPCSQNHLGRLIYLDAATIKGVVDRLAGRGLVTALGDLTDRRRRAVELTERGREVAQMAILAAAEITAATLSPLSAEEKRTLSRLMKKLS